MKTRKGENVSVLSKKSACIEFFSAYRGRDIARMLGLCEKDGNIYFEPLGETGKGKIGILGRSMWHNLLEAFSGLNNMIMKIDLDEDKNQATCIVSIFGTQMKEFAGIPSKGNYFKSDHTFVLKFNSKNKMDNITVRWNHDHLMQQLTA